MHPLSQQIRSVGRKARRLLLWRGVAWWICALLVTALVLAGADYWFRFGERPMRWLATMAVVALGIWSWIRLVWPAWSLWCSDETIAGWIEKRFPDLRDRLTSAVSFMRQDPDDGRFGSRSLRQELVQHVAGEVAGRDLGDCLDSRAVWRAGTTLLVVGLSVLALCAADLQSATIAARRLAMPWRDEMWPRRNWLAFVQHPEKLAKGQDFLVELIDKRGWLPPAVEIQYWFSGDGEDDIRRHPMIYAGGKMTHRLPRVDRTFRYRAVGGDDNQMPWIELKVVDPPQLVEAEIRLRPPAYTGLPEQISGRHIRGVEGTVLEITGRVNKPIAMATFEFAAGAKVETAPARVRSDGLEFRLPADPEHEWRLSSSGEYSWALVDRDAFAIPAPGKSAIDVMVDKPPAISLEWPPPGASFTPQAQVPLRLVVKDDLAVQRVAWEFGDVTQVIEMRTDPPPIEATDAWPPHGEQRSIEHLVDLRAFGDLQPGQTLFLRVVATDFKPQDSDALEISLSILSLDEWKARIEQRQMTVRQRLLETLRLQRTVRMQTAAYRDESVQVDAAASQSARLPGIQLGQSRVRAQLEGSQGVIPMVASLLDELRINRVEDLQLSQELSRTSDDLHRIARELLPVVEQNLLRAERLEREVNARREKVGAGVAVNSADALKGAVEGQDQIIQSLEELIDRLGEWSAYRMLAQDVAQLQEEQEALQNETGGLPMASKDVLQLSVTEKQVLSQLSERQSELALRVERINQRLERMRRQIGEGNALAVSAMDEALGVIRELAITAHMRQAAQQLLQNRIGSAGTDQGRALQGLQRLYESLLQRPEQDVARAAEQLDGTAADLKQLQDRQSRVADQAAEAERAGEASRKRLLDQVAQSEQELAAAVREIMQRLERLGYSSAARALNSAADHMRSSEQAARAADAAQSARESRAATQVLENIHQQLSRDADAARQRQADLESQFLSQQLSGLRDRQEAVGNLTAELSGKASEDGLFPAAVLAAAIPLSGQQSELAQVARGLADQVKSRAAFELALQHASKLMDQAARRLVESGPDAEVTRGQRRAMTLIGSLLDALREDAPQASDNSSQEKNASVPPSQKDQQPANQSRVQTAELKLLRAWQDEINIRTASILAEKTPTQPLSESEQRELSELAAEQLRLAEMVERLLEAK